jgi:hypothetical protein
MTDAWVFSIPIQAKFAKNKLTIVTTPPGQPRLQLGHHHFHGKEEKVSPPAIV